METLSPSSHGTKNLPIRILQFGEGNFLRAFVDYMIDEAAKQGVVDSSVAIVKPIQYGSLDRFKEQGNLFTLITSGLSEGKRVDEKRIIHSIADAVDAYEDYEQFMAYAKSPDLRFVVSNTTEAGITLNESDKIEDCPPISYPAKLTKLLYERFRAFDGDSGKGLFILPCELIENNGSELRKCVLKTAENWALPPAFIRWVENCCGFSSTLVDRIVTGYPKAREKSLWQELGYIDNLMDCCEPFALWVIEDKSIGKSKLSEELPLHKAGLPVVFTDDVLPYRNRKVRILNGAHTTTVPAAFLGGYDYVNRCMDDKTVLSFMQGVLHEEIIPTLTLPKQELEEFAKAVKERFENPFIDHALLSITLNSVSKWKARVLPSTKDYIVAKKALPKRIVFSFAALCAFYLGSEYEDGALVGNRNGEPYLIKDDCAVLAFFAGVSKQYLNGVIGAKEYILSIADNSTLWGESLHAIKGFTNLAVNYFNDIMKNGSLSAMSNVNDGK